MMRKRIGQVTVALAFVLAACGGGEAETAASPTTAAPGTSEAPTTTQVTTTTVAPSTTEVTSTVAPTTTPPPPTTTTEPAIDLASVVGGTALGDAWLVEPGRYSTDRTGTALVFDLAEPVAWLDLENLLIFQHADLTERDIVAVSSFVGIIPAGEIGTHPPHDPPIPANTVDVPADMGDWFAAAGQVVVEASGEATLSDGSAPYWDITVDPSAGDTFGCFLGACVANLVHQDGNGAWVFGDEYSFRIYQLNGAMDGLFVFVQAHPENFEAVTSLSELVVGGMSIAG